MRENLSFYPLKVTDAQTTLKLKIPQLTLGELVRMDRHWDDNTKVFGSFLVR